MTTFRTIIEAYWLWQETEVFWMYEGQSISFEVALALTKQYGYNYDYIPVH
jgi:hypothetical protein